MINPKQIIKVGRSELILEVNDRLQVNDFYNLSGVFQTTVHGTFSRINLCLVDVKSGSKDKAKVSEFNFSIDDLHTLTKLCGIVNFQNINDLEKIFNPDLFKKNVSIYNKEVKKTEHNFAYGLKVNPYKKNNQGMSPVTKIILSYEEQMRSNYKWKITVESGLAVANEGKEAFLKGAMKNGTYKKLYSSFINIDQGELLDIIISTIQHINLWESTNYGQMLKNREAFMERFKVNNYDESTINVWNNDPNKNEDKKKDVNENNLSRTQSSADSGQVNSTDKKPASFKCSHCNCEVDENIKKYSEKRYGSVLCIKCQKEQQNVSIKPQNGNACVNCGSKINDREKDYSIKKYGKALCRNCQKAISV